jgi:hypothetical protein
VESHVIDVLYSATLAACPTLAPDSVASLLREAGDRWGDYKGARRPWEGRNASQRAERTLTLQRTKMKSVIGDIDSPNWHETEDKILAEMRAVKEFDEAEAEEGEMNLAHAAISR